MVTSITMACSKRKPNKSQPEEYTSERNKWKGKESLENIWSIKPKEDKSVKLLAIVFKEK